MGLYRRYLFPLLLEKGLDTPEVERERRTALAPARGRVLEVGFGFGASLVAYPDTAGGTPEVIGLEPHDGLLRRAGTRAARASFAVHRVRGDAHRLPFRSGVFDTVVTQFTLCSLADPDACLAEIARVMAPDGRLLFLEHGRSDDPRVARWQEWLAPLFRVLGDGCRPYLKIDDVVRSGGLRIVSLERFEFGTGPQMTRSMYRGSACVPGGGGR